MLVLFRCSPFSVPHQPHILTHHHPIASALQVEPQIPLQLSTSSSSSLGMQESSITVLESGHGELKKIYPQQNHDHNNNGNVIYQNLTAIHSNQVKSETHSPIDGSSNKIPSPECKSGHETPAMNLPSSNNTELNVDMSNDRPRCWTKI